MDSLLRNTFDSYDPILSVQMRAGQRVEFELEEYNYEWRFQEEEILCSKVPTESLHCTQNLYSNLIASM